MNATKKVIVIIMSVLMGAGSVRAQYYTQGQAPASIRWMQVKTQGGRIIFPQGYEYNAARVKMYLDSVRPLIGYGFRHPPMNMPVVLSTHNFASNGLVMLAPKRMELMVAPDMEPHAEPWLKQLTTHESRHSVQFNNVNRGFIKGLSYVLGEQGSLIGGALLPLWMMEGDAVMAETELSSFGRGLQPSFTIDYRAYALEDSTDFALDKWFCGSYRDNIPDHYHIGYQVVSWAYTKYGENVWDKVARFGSSYPFLILTTKISLGKYYHTSVNRLSRETLADLRGFWRSQPRLENSAGVITTPVSSFTEYKNPLPVDANTVVAMKSDMDKPTRLVEIDTRTGSERLLCRTGAVSTRPSVGGGRVYWTEYRQDPVWEQRVNSTLCWYDLKTGRRGIDRSQRRVLYPTPLAGGGMALAEYNYDGHFTVRLDLPGNTLRMELPLWISVHGMAWDEVSRSLYIIGLDDSGMWIGRVGDNGLEMVKDPSRVSIYNLSAGGGRLYFNSIASGRDEAHMLDIATDKESRITTSTYGSFAPAPFAGGRRVALTTYTKNGYMVSTQAVDEGRMEEVEYSTMPENVVNPPRKHWDLDFNIDSMVVNAPPLPEKKRYRRVPHMFNVHSWAPVAFDPENILQEERVNVNLGATVISQDVLNTSLTTLTYAWTDQGSKGSIEFSYMGLAPKFELEAVLGPGKQQAYYAVAPTAWPAAPNLDPKFNIMGGVYLPLLLSSGSRVRYMVPRVDFQHTNALVLNPVTEKLEKGKVNKLYASLYFSDMSRLGKRDFLPALGYYIRGSITGNPLSGDFGRIESVQAGGYFPGLGRHHSLSVRASAQHQTVNYFHFQQKELYPRGADFNVAPNHYYASSVNYQLPLWCPDGGITSIIYFKRLRLNLGFDYATYRPFPAVATGGGFSGHAPPWVDVYSYGMNLNLDVNLLRVPASGTNVIGLSLYRPSDTKKWVFGFSMTLPI